MDAPPPPPGLAPDDGGGGGGLVGGGLQTENKTEVLRVRSWAGPQPIPTDRLYTWDVVCGLRHRCTF